MNCSHKVPFLCYPFFQGQVPGNAEIHDFDPLMLVYHNIVRLDIPVNKAPCMGIGEGRSHGACDSKGFTNFKELIVFQELGYVLPLHKLHGDADFPFFLGNAEDTDDIGVIHLCRHTGFLQEALKVFRRLS